MQNIICLIKANQELNLIPNDKLNLFNLCNPDFMASYFTWLYEKRGYFLVTEVNAVSKTKAMWNPEGSFFYENSSFYSGFPEALLTESYRFQVQFVKLY